MQTASPSLSFPEASSIGLGAGFAAVAGKAVKEASALGDVTVGFAAAGVAGAATATVFGAGSGGVAPMIVFAFTTIFAVLTVVQGKNGFQSPSRALCMHMVEDSSAPPSAASGADVAAVATSTGLAGSSAFGVSATRTPCGWLPGEASNVVTLSASVIKPGGGAWVTRL